MAKKAQTVVVKHESVPKKTSQSKRNHSVAFSSMNKARRRSFKTYRGQGR